MNKHTRKLIAPIVITVIFLLYLGGYMFLLMNIPENILIRLLLAVPLILLGGGMIYVMVSRIREIRSGEEDDLGNY